MYCLPLSYGNNGLYKAETLGKKVRWGLFTHHESQPSQQRMTEFGRDDELMHTERKRIKYADI